MKKIIYYKDELNDDFASTIKKVNPLPENYCYVSKNPLFKLFSFVIYRLLARPLVWCYTVVKFRHKYVNKKAINKLRSGCMIYGNHVTVVGEAFIPNLISIKKRNYIVTGKETNSLTCILPLLKALGNIPLGQTPAQQCRMYRCIKQRLREGHTVTVYPEAHIWPYYTGIRPFAADSFRVAAMCNVPVFSMTKCFQKKRLGKTPKVVTFIDGPFYPKQGLTHAQNAQYLRDVVYEKMIERAQAHSTYVYYEYRKTEDENDGTQSN